MWGTRSPSRCCLQKLQCWPSGPVQVTCLFICVGETHSVCRDAGHDRQGALCLWFLFLFLFSGSVLHSLGWPQTHQVIDSDLEFLRSCLHLRNARMKVSYHHTQFLDCWRGIQASGTLGKCSTNLVRVPANTWSFTTVSPS